MNQLASSSPLSLPPGMRATKAVQALLALLPAQPEQGWTEALVEAALHQQGIGVNRVTIYRALDRLTKAGLLQRSIDLQRITRYFVSTAPPCAERALPYMECRACHQPLALRDGAAAVQSALLTLRQALAHSTGLATSALDIAIVGECANCTQRLTEA